MKQKTPEFQEQYFEKSDFERIFYQKYIPSNPKGAVCVIHGYTEHSGRYADVMNFFAEKNFAVIAPDLPGHGRSAKTLGDMKDFRKSVDSVAELVKTVQKEHSLPRCFCIGHSLGGCMTLSLAGLYPKLWKGIVTIAAMILIPDYVSPLLRFISNILAALFPRLPVQNIDLKNATQNEAVKEKARQDPLYYRGKIRARMGIQMLKGMELSRSVLQYIKAPALILHGTKDVIMPPKGSELIFSELRVKDKTHRVYEGWYHELLNEPDKEKLFNFILKWIDARNK